MGARVKHLFGQAKSLLHKSANSPTKTINVDHWSSSYGQIYFRARVELITQIELFIRGLFTRFRGNREVQQRPRHASNVTWLSARH